ncbi:hypothetical protein SAMN05192558_104260 [Actinokineospora alba]|uniref:Uncharacterized protein n=1 Tax=Actinokineospora alba TaxID=504798 RepID=A0A1H0LS74_9PSEU|nr:hypothetical protein [Actinokineospora alba]TDP67432.1 hypothetical protein C8E96_2977 [Actinokineospora alba]SDI96950.1 hypothetical protein SAMN05421871_10937 [Actinokineospora alba]SDO70974.1 hypothetical protein SAMN05192558_104260 [Actinokineospora alba]
MNPTDQPSGPPPTPEPQPGAKDEWERTPLFDALCAEFGFPVGSLA